MNKKPDDCCTSGIYGKAVDVKKKERGGKFYELLKKEKGHMPGT